MTAPGWYQADGDPVGTNRYWDGETWVGEPVPSAPVAAQAAAGGFGYADGSGAVKAFPSGLKTLAIIVSVLKALGWAGLLIATIWVASFLDDANELDNAFGGTVDLGGAVGAAIGTMAVVLIMGALLLFFQFRSATRENASSLFNVALIMTILDGLTLVLVLLGAANASNDDFSSDNGNGNWIMVLAYVAIFIAQLMVAIKAKKAS